MSDFYIVLISTMSAVFIPNFLISSFRFKRRKFHVLSIYQDQRRIDLGKNRDKLLFKSFQRSIKKLRRASRKGKRDNERKLQRIQLLSAGGVKRGKLIKA